MPLNLRQNQRNSSIELLRVLSMVVIIAHHIAIHSGFQFAAEAVTVNRLWVQFLQLGGKVGVNCFVLISGYFLINAPTLKLNKVVRLWGQIFSCGIVLYLIFTLFGGYDFQLKTFLEGVFPITFSAWWFASAYFVMYLLSPYLNRLLCSLSKREYLGLLALMLLCWSIVPTFLFKDWQGSDLVWFAFLYALAGYIRLHTDLTHRHSAPFFLVAGAMALLTYLSAVVLDLVGTKFAVAAQGATVFFDMQRLPTLITSIAVFLGVLCLKPRHNPAVNLLSGAMFGVYLLHDNRFVRILLWETLFKNASYQDSPLLIPYTVLQVVLVFVACAAMELLRIYAIEKPCQKLTDRIGSLLERLTKGLMDRLFHRL